MLEIFGKNYYIDIDAITRKCRTGKVNENEEEDDEVTEINIFKYETVKFCIERVLTEFESPDETLGEYSSDNMPISFKIAFNTLLKNEIILEEEDE